jgi:polysaccharide biosynthesis/export protein
MVISPGDELEVVFFGAPNLSVVQTVRSDGKMAFQLLGEVAAAGKTPVQLRAELSKLAESQLQVKDVNVVVRAPAPVFVGGAVLQPGALRLTYPTTVLQAIMQAGGFRLDVADVTSVVVIRYAGGRSFTWRFNFEKILDGEASESDQPFYLKPFDMIYVPEGGLF